MLRLALLLLTLLLAAPASATPRHDGLDDVPMDALREAMRARPALAQAWFRLKAGDATGARKDLQALVPLDRKDPSTWHLLGIAAAAEGKPVLAAQSLRRSLRLRADGWTVMHLVTNLVDRGRLLDAERVLRRTADALAADPHHARARAWVLVARDDLDGARALLEELEGRSGEAALSWQLSALLAAMGDAPAALAAIRRAVAADPDHPAYRRELYERLRAAGDWQGLVQATSETGSDAVGGGLAPYYRGIGLLRLGRADEAMAAFAAVVEHGRPAAEPLAGAAGYLLQLGQYADAEEAARAALATRPEDAPLHHLLAMTLTRMDREGEALAHYRRASELAPADADHRFDLLVSLCSLGRSAEFESALLRATKDFPEDERLPVLADRCVVPES